MDTAVAILVKASAVLAAAGLVWLAVGALKRWLPPNHRLQHRLARLSGEGPLLNAGRLLLLVVLFAVGLAVTVLYS